MNNYLIVPGYGNSGPDHWQTYFEKKLPACFRIDQKSWDKPVMQDWVSNINTAVMQYDPESVILISHSMGGIAIAHWASHYNLQIKGAMIVAPPDLENPFQNLPIENFTPVPTKKLPFPSVIVASSNDYWVTKERTIQFSRNWGSELLFIENAGHINAESGYTNWDDGLDILRTIG